MCTIIAKKKFAVILQYKMLCFMLYNWIFLKLIYYFHLLLQQIFTKHFVASWPECRTVTYEYANEIAFNTGRNSGLKYNYCPGNPQCYHTDPDKENLSQLI